MIYPSVAQIVKGLHNGTFFFPEKDFPWYSMFALFCPIKK